MPLVRPLLSELAREFASGTKISCVATRQHIEELQDAVSISRYAVCSTAIGTAAKTASITRYTLVSSVVVVVYGNVANSPTLNITSTGAKPITRKGVAISPGKKSRLAEHTCLSTMAQTTKSSEAISINSPITVHGMIMTRPTAMYIIHRGVLQDWNLAARKAVFESTHPFVVVKAAEELFTVNPNDWSKKLMALTAELLPGGLSLDGNFVIRYPYVLVPHPDPWD